MKEREREERKREREKRIKEDEKDVCQIFVKPEQNMRNPLFPGAVWRCPTISTATKKREYYERFAQPQKSTLASASSLFHR